MRDVPTDTTPLLGDFDGDPRANILWYGPGGRYDVLWYGRLGAAAVTVNGTYRPVPVDFSGGGVGDVLWWAPGPPTDVL